MKFRRWLVIRMSSEDEHIGGQERHNAASSMFLKVILGKIDNVTNRFVSVDMSRVSPNFLSSKKR